MLCGAALRAYEKYGSTIDPATGTRIQRGLLLYYEALPGAIPKVMLPLFSRTVLTASWLEKMKVESTQYSKGRLPTKNHAIP